MYLIGYVLAVLTNIREKASDSGETGVTTIEVH
jgi:hypothetical protein